MVVPHGANNVTLTNHEGKRLGMEGDKMINEIPEAEVVDPVGFLSGASGNSIFIVPADADYQIAIAGNDKKPASNHTDDMHGVSVFSEGQSVTVDTPKLNANETDTLSVHRDGPIKYKTGSGKIPPMSVAVDHENGGVLVHLSNMKADKGDEVELHVNRAAGHVLVQGGGKKADSYDIRVKHVGEKDDTVVEQKGVKFHAGESHKIGLEQKPGAQQLAITRGKASPMSTTVAKPAVTPAATPVATPVATPATKPARSMKR